MADALPESALAALDDPFAQLTGPLAETTRLDFEVVDSARLTPHMQRLRLTAPQLDGFGYLPGPMPLVGGALKLVNSQVIGNTAAAGGGIFNNLGTVTLVNALIIANHPDNCEPTGTITGCKN